MTRPGRGVWGKTSRPSSQQMLIIDERDKKEEGEREEVKEEERRESADPVHRVSKKGELGGLHQEKNVVGAAGGSQNGGK